MNFMERLQKTADVLIFFQSIQTFMVEEYGKPMELHLSQWILSHPEQFQDALRRLYAAGCDIIMSATQASSPFRTKPFGAGLVDKVYEFNYKSAKLAKEAAPEGCYVSGFISSSNPDFLEPVGSYTHDEVYKGYLEQVNGLIDGGVDLMTVIGNHIDETTIAIRVIKDHSDLPIMAGDVFYAGKKGFRDMMGLDPRAAAVRIQEAGADVVGFGCGLMTKSTDTSEWYPAASALLQEMKSGTDRYLWLAPDAGLAQLVGDKTVYPASPEEMAHEVVNWIGNEARIVGGCCGTSLEHVRKMSVVIESQKTRRF
jgi:5-methyltetrahydrofolate--homocysteine methyltransferase